MPVTYPPPKVNGILISGFLATDVNKATHPPEVAEYLKGIGYRIDVNLGQARKDKERFIEDLHYTLKKRKRSSALFDGKGAIGPIYFFGWIGN